MPLALRLPRRCAPRNDTKMAGFYEKPAIFISEMFEIRREATPHGVLPGRYIMRPQGRTWPTGSSRCEAPAAAVYFLPQSGRTRVASESSRRTRVASECSGSPGAASEPCGALCGSSGATRRTRVASVTPCGAFGSSGRARGIMRVSSKDAGCQAGSRSAS